METTIWNPAEEARKKYSGLSDWSDEEIFKNLSDPKRFREAFPEYGHLDDDTISRNLSRVQPSSVTAAAAAPPAKPKISVEPESVLGTVGRIAKSWLPKSEPSQSGEPGPTLQFPRETKLSPLPTPGIWGRFKESVVGGPRTGETLQGQAVQVLRGERPLIAVGPATLIRPEAYLPDPDSKAERVARGALKGIGEMTSPENALMLTGVGGAVKAVGKLGLPFVQRAISAGFAADMIHGLYEREPEFRAAADEGDENRVWELLGETLPTGAMAAGAAIHGLKPGTRLRAPAADRPRPEEPVSVSAQQERTNPPAAPKPAAPKPVTPRPVPPPPAVPLPASAESSGAQTLLRTPAGDTPVRYRVVEADTLQPSHDPFTFQKNPRYPEGVQERQYQSNKSAQMDVIRMAEAPRWEMLVNSDPTALNGPPQVTPPGIVLGGNSRTMMLKRAYQGGKGEEYKRFLESQAQQFGVDPQEVRSMQKPVLVRELANAPIEAEGMRRLAQALNRGFTKGLSEIESAVSAGKNLSQQSAEAITGELTKGGEAATLRSAMESNPKLFRDVLLRDGLIQETDLPRYFNEYGALNTVGKDFVENALLGRIVQDANLLQSLPKSLTGKLERSIPSLIELGGRNDAWNITGEVLEAARMAAQAQAKGWSIEKFLRQRGMFEQPNERVGAIAELLTQSPTKVADALRRFAAESRQDTGSALFEGAFDPLESFTRIIQGRKAALETSPTLLRRAGGPAWDPIAAARQKYPGLRDWTGAEIAKNLADPKKFREAFPERTANFAQTGPPASTAAASLPRTLAPAQPQPLVRRGDIVSRLRRGLGELPIRVGLLGKRTPGLLGFYKVGPELVRLKEALDLPTIAHEAGHHINKVLWGTTRGGGLNLSVLKPFAKELAPLSYDPKKPLLEGFPEFVRLYLTEPNNAKARAPQFYSFFEKEIERSPGLKETLLDTQHQIALYQQQPSVAKVLAHIRKDVPAPRRNVWNRFYTHVVDQLTPIRKAVEGMAEQGVKPPTEKNAYELARLNAGWAGKAEHFLERGTFDSDTLQPTGKPLQAVLKPVADRLDEFRAYLVSRRTLEKAAQGKRSGISVADAQAAVQSLDRTPGFQQAAQELTSYQDSVLDYLGKSGFSTPEQLAHIKKLNRAYVPFYRLFDDVWSKQPKGSGGQRIVDLPQAVKGMKGSTREIIDPLESVIKNTYAFINLAERNRIANALVEQARTTEGAGKWLEPIPAGKKPTTFRLDEIVDDLLASGADLEGADLQTAASVFRSIKPSGENVISVWRKGKPNYYEVHPELFRALKALDSESSNILIRLLSMPARALRLGATGISPEFVIRNPIRDAMTAFTQSKHGFLPGLDTMRGLFHALKRDDLYWEWKRAGGEHAAMVSLDRTAMQSELKDLLGSKMQWAARHPIDALRTVSEAMEAATRVGEYRKARAAGETPRSAALGSREVTLDFARQGASTKAVNAIVAFWNATVQGTDKFARVHIENPKRAIALGAAGITLPSMLLYAVNRDDPTYQELPPWMKDFFWLVPTKGTPAANSTPFIPIPKPFLWGMVYGSVPERAMKWIDTKDPGAFDELLQNVGASSLPSAIPTVAVPFVEAFANRSTFTGRPIESPGMQRLPAPYRYQPWTTEFAKSMSLALNKAGIQVSPVMLEQAIFSYTGGAGRLAMQAASVPLKGEAPRPSRQLADVPLARAFAVRWPTTQTESVQSFYDRLETLEQRSAAERAKDDNPDLPETTAFSSAEMEELRWLRANSRQLSQLRAEIRRIENSMLPAGQKRDEIDALTLEMMNLAKEALQPVGAAQ